MTLDIYTDSRVLRKRGFSEALARHAANVAEDIGATVLVDLGTGSGIVALGLARALPSAVVWATEVREEALEVARLNAARNDIPLRFARGDWFSALPEDLKGNVDVAVATPPYLTPAEYDLQDEPQRRHTPLLAMVGGETGLDATRSLATQGREWLRPGGCLLIECHPERIDETADLVASLGYRIEKNPWLVLVKAWKA